MSNEYLEGFLKDQYKAEIDRSDKLDGAVNLPTAIVTVLLGVGGFYLEHLPKVDGRRLAYAFYVVTVIYFVLLLTTLICLVRSFFRYRYRLIANPKEIVDFARGLRAHYAAEMDDEAVIDEKVKKETQENLIDQYTEASAQNRERNLTRTDWLYWTTYSLLACLVTLMLSRALFYAISDPNPKPQEVKITAVPDMTKVIVVFPDVQKVEVNGIPKVNVVRTPALQKVEIVSQPPVIKVEIVQPKAEPKEEKKDGR